MENTFLDAFLTAQKLKLAKQGRLDEIEQRALDRMMREKEINAQISHQQNMEAFQRQQLEDARKQQAAENAFKAAQGVAQGMFFDAAPQQATPGLGPSVEAALMPVGKDLVDRLGPPTLRAGLPQLPEALLGPQQTITPPGNVFNFGGKQLVPVDAGVRQARELRGVEAEAESRAMAQARGHVKALELERQSSKAALDEFFQRHPDVLTGDEKTEAYLSAMGIKDWKSDQASRVVGRALMDVASGDPARVASGTRVMNLYNQGRMPQPTPTFERDKQLDAVASSILQRTLAQYRGKDGKLKLPKRQDFWNGLLATAESAGLGGDLGPVADRLKKLLTTDPSFNMVQWALEENK